MTEDAKKPLGRILLRQRAVTQPQLDKALESATPGGPPLASRMIESGALSEIAALKALSEQSGVPGIDLNQVCIRLGDLNILPREVAVRHKLLPVLVREDRIFVAMAAPTEKKVVDELEFVTGKRLYPYIALAGPLMRAIAAAYEMRDRGEAFYVGPHCPPEIQRKAGYVAPDAAAAPAEPATGAAAAPDKPGARAGQAPRAPADEGRPANLPPPLPPRAARAQPATGPRPPINAGAAPQVRRPAPEPEVSRPSDPDAGFQPSPARPTATSSTPVVVDDAMNRMAGADELNEADFGSIDRELSQVAQLPKDPQDEPPVEGKQTVLVVDDEPDIRKMVRRQLEARGYRVIEAGQGHEALNLLKEQTPDLIVLDAMLPEVHGFDIAKRIKGTERYGHIPIVMISAVYKGWRFAEDLKQSYGVEAYLEKPFRMADLLSAIEAALERRPAPSRAEAISAEAEKMLSQGIEAYQKGDIEHAIEYLREGTRIDPLAYRLHFHLGLLYGKQGKVYDAIQELQTALDINGRHFPALKNLAVLYQKVGFRNKAIEAWERALRVAPDDPTRQSIKEHLVGLL
jgi:DNA-binding response OmpR family regulator